MVKAGGGSLFLRYSSASFPSIMGAPFLKMWAMVNGRSKIIWAEACGVFWFDQGLGLRGRFMHDSSFNNENHTKILVSVPVGRALNQVLFRGDRWVPLSSRGGEVCLWPGQQSGGER